jgi:hypothetical protein
VTQGDLLRWEGPITITDLQLIIDDGHPDRQGVQESDDQVHLLLDLLRELRDRHSFGLVE